MSMIDRLESEAHVWLTAPAEPELADRYLELLPCEELEQFERYKLDRPRHLYLAARALARSSLSLYAPEVEPADWRFEFNKHGRPEICKPKGLPPLRFNLSHTEGLVACLVTLELDAGVDVERVDRRVNYEGIARSKFSSLEARELRRLVGSAQRERFFRYWTLKEAYIKARGMGLALPLGSFSYLFDSPGEVSIQFADDLGDVTDDWQLGLWQTSTDHYLAAAIRRGQKRDLEWSIRRSSPLAESVETLEPDEVARSSRRLEATRR